MLKRAFFITGTDTGVGKTVATACLIKTLQNQGFVVGVAKPFESGGNQDGVWLKQLTGQPDAWDAWAFPYKFKAPMAPGMAAKKAGIKPSLKRVVAGLGNLQKKVDVLLVEGAGGLMVPLSADQMVIDLMQALGYPAIIVSRLKLGTINHSLLTVQALRQRKVPVAGWIFNRLGPERLTEVERMNPSAIEKLSGVPVLGLLPYTQGLLNFPPFVRILSRNAQASLYARLTQA